MSVFTTIRKRAFAGLLAITCLGAAQAQNVTVDVAIDSLHLLIGQQTRIKLDVSYDASQKMVLPHFNDTLVTGVELVDVAKPDTQYLNNKQRLLVSQEYIVTSFDSALYYIPPFEVKVDGKSYYSKELALNVQSLPVDTLHPEQFFGPKDVMSPAFTWEDWELVFWLTLLMIPLVALVVYLVKRYRDNKPIIRTIKVEPKLPPHEQALKDIERIKAEKSWQKEEPKTYYTELTDVLRTYIKERFGFNALEMTSTEIVEALLQEKDQKSIAELKDLFSTADLVKFAKFNPLMNENDRNLVSAIDFINETKIEPDPNAKAQPTEITIEEKRSRRSKLILLASIVLISIAVLVMLGIVIHDICKLCF